MNLADLGYDGKLYFLAFDHRGSFQKKMFGISGSPTPEDTERIADAKKLIFEGMLLVLEGGGERPEELGVLVDEQFGGDIPAVAKERGLSLAMPVEKSGQDEFDFEYGDDFGAHIEKFDVDFAKVLVRYNPDTPGDLNPRQNERLRRLSDWLHENGKKFLLELLVPAEPGQLEQVGGSQERYDAELRPELMRRSIEQMQQAGIEADIWKIEGLETTADCEMIAKQTRTGGRNNVKCVLLGRGADNAKVDHWLYQAAPVDGFIGFAIGRSIWWDPLKSFLDGGVDREKAAAQVAENFVRFIEVYRQGQ